jgi:threonine dehydrogenase-like Zn-dependent dehydrogenase
MDPWHYTLVEVGAIASRCISVAYPAKGETAVVIGQGLIGLLAARWLISYGVSVIVCDLEEFRLEKSRKLDVAYAINGRVPDIKERILSLCPAGADIVIEASSSQAGADIAASILRQPTSRIVEKRKQQKELDARYGSGRICITTHMENIGWPELFGYDVNRYLEEP